MDTLETQLQKSFLFLERMQGETPAIIKKNLDIAQKKILELIATTQNQRTITTEINKILNEAFEPIEETINIDKEKISELAWNATGVIMAQWATAKPEKWVDISSEVKKQIVNPNTKIQGSTISKELKKLSKKHAKPIAEKIKQGFEDGIGIDAIDRDIRNSLGILQRNQLNSLTRTVLLEAIEDSQNKLYDTFFKKEIIGYTYSAILDNRTTPYCINAHGYFTENRNTAKYRPKTHWRCRSRWEPETELSKEFKEKQRLVQWSGKTVNHRDGTKSTKFRVSKVKRIPADAKGTDVFDFWDEKYKRDYLGDKRYELYRTGKATFREMINITKNRLIPIKELEKKLNL